MYSLNCFSMKNNETAFYFKVPMLYVIPIFPEAVFSWPFCNEQSVALSLNLIYVEQEGEALGSEK